jgi:hypothetical protein
LAFCPEPGVTITYSEEDRFQVFAPNSDAMAEAKEQINDILNEVVRFLQYCFLNHLLMSFKSQEAEDVKLEFGAVYKAKIEEIR